MAGSLALLGAIIAVAAQTNAPAEVLAYFQSPASGKNEPASSLFLRYGCAGCHEIPGVAGAKGRAGPSLADYSDRLYVAGALRNEPANLIRWIVNPRAIEPRTAMPVTGISEGEAARLAEYLLRQD
jgi:cytochrome c2